MSAVAHSAQFLVGASIIVLLSAYLYQLFWGAHSSQRQMAGSGGGIPHQRRFRNLTLRVDLIPISTSSAELESELKSIIAGNPDLRGQLDDLVVRSIAPRDCTYACATVTGKALLPEEQLLARLQNASEALPYQYDCAFYGITPLYEDASGAQCDVIAVPGLASHAIGSWKSPGGNDLWLRDWLSDDIPNIRVLLYGYNTKLLKSNAKSSVEDLGRRFLESLTAFRASDDVGPLTGDRRQANNPADRASPDYPHRP
ncbi:Protein SERAC1 [Apiospora arundinis]|uniref:Protein SERAC1 n=1 Tax=Apiospora arundinis TaxID=335852 RepID=A0ABR2IF73_9PEZI